MVKFGHFGKISQINIPILVNERLDDDSNAHFL